MTRVLRASIWIIGGPALALLLVGSWMLDLAEWADEKIRKASK